MATQIIQGVQYSGIWSLAGQANAKALTTWPTQPGPSLYAWGRGASGELGLGNTTGYSSPKAVGSLKNWLIVSAGGYHSAAIKTDGTLWTWGMNSSGQLGLGNTTYYSSPKQVGALTSWSKITASGGSCYAVKTDGTLWCWGFNSSDYGNLGLGNLTYYSSPKQIGSLTGWASVFAGNQQQVLAIKTNGTLWSWGQNNVGQLGLNNQTNYSSPKQVGSLTNWASATCAQQASYALKTDGTIWAWGGNSAGNLGLGNTTYYSSPKQIGALTTWSNIASGVIYCSAIKTDGTLWSWGYNVNGQLGLGNTTNYSSPKQVGSLTNWSQVIISKAQYSGAIKTDGTLWSWGKNAAGQLGLGNTTSYSSPKQIGSLTNWLSASAGGITFGFITAIANA